jgi:hypothetical protein
MKIKSGIWVLGAVALTACSAVPGLLSGDSGSALDSYFATSVGKVAGNAKALATVCPSLSFNQAELDLHRVAICRGGGMADDCTVPNLVSATEQAFTERMALLAGMSPAEVCTKASAEMSTDPVLAEYLK